VPRAVRLPADRFNDQGAGAVGTALDGESRDGARPFHVGPGIGNQAHVAAGQLRENRGGVGAHGFQESRGEFASQQIG
jgi:hypothetical protein